MGDQIQLKANKVKIVEEVEVIIIKETKEKEEVEVIAVIIEEVEIEAEEIAIERESVDIVNLVLTIQGVEQIVNIEEKRINQTKIKDQKKEENQKKIEKIFIPH